MKKIFILLTVLTLIALICIPTGQVQGIDSHPLTPIVKYDLTFIQTTQTQAIANTLIITAKDADSNTVPYTSSVTLTSSDTQAIYPTSNIVITNGVGSATFYFGTAGPQTITALDTQNSQLVGTTMTNVAPIYYTLTTSSTQVSAGQTVNITITAIDAQNQVLTGLGNQGYGATLTFASTDAAAILPDENANHKLVSGTGTFNITLNTQGQQTITVTNKDFNQITSTTNAITVNPTTTPTQTPTPTATPTPTQTATPTQQTTQPQATNQPTPPPTKNTPLDTLPIAAAAIIGVVAVLALLIRMRTGKLKRSQPLPPPPPPTNTQNQP